jgi:hypothetical protein
MTKRGVLFRKQLAWERKIMKRTVGPQTIKSFGLPSPRRNTVHSTARRFFHIPRIGAPILLSLLAACGTQPARTSFSTPTVAVPPTVTPAPATQTPTAAVLPEPALSSDGPWLLVNTAQGLWAANSDGSGGTLLTAGRVLIPGPLSEAASPVGGNIAYLTSTDFTQAYGNYPNLKLNILTLPDPHPVATLPLTSPQTEPTAQNPSDILRAMVERKSFAWSPEGKRLAYIGAAQGPSADLYEYLTATGATLRLTDGPDQAYGPLWSPDGKWIVQTAAAGFGTGAGIAVTGIYAARADGSGVISLYDVSHNSGGEYGIGWLNANTLVTNSWFITCGPSNVRLVDLSAQKADLAFEGCLSAAAVAPGRGTLLFAQSPDTARFNQNPQPGLFILSDGARKPRLLIDADFREIVWSEGSRNFLARTADNNLYEISSGGDTQLLSVQEPQIPTVSPNGQYWVLADAFTPNSLSGVWIGEYGKDFHQIFSDKITPGQIFFSPPGDALYFLDPGGNLYRAQAPDWTPALLAKNLPLAVSDVSMAWVIKGNEVFV